jgi:hypothetical protein
MARINIDDSIYKDSRFLKLVLALGDMDRAFGALVRAWALAQKWYLSTNRMIPESEWVKQGIPDAVIEAGLAERSGQFIRTRGADDQFGWLIKCQQGGAENKGKSRKGTIKGPLREVKGSESSLLSSPFSLLPSPDNSSSLNSQNKNLLFHRVAKFRNPKQNRTIFPLGSRGAGSLAAASMTSAGLIG